LSPSAKVKVAQRGKIVNTNDMASNSGLFITVPP
jgi:hypothetical protein